MIYIVICFDGKGVTVFGHHSRKEAIKHSEQLENSGFATSVEQLEFSDRVPKRKREG